jgi:hypothetical protein
VAFVIKALAALVFCICSAAIHADETLVPFEKIKTVLTSYAGATGCVLRLENKNILAYDMEGDGTKEFVVLFGINPGCSGGTATHRFVFAVLEYGISGRIFVRPAQSFPAATLEGFVQNIERIFIEDDHLWYEGKEYDWANDALCCPSIPVKAKIFFSDGAWTASHGH